jgi:Flp pilus assembly protein TadG
MTALRQLRQLNKDDGQSLVEFALVAVMLVMILLGVVEMSWMVLQYTTVTHATRAGERYAIVHGGERTGTGIDGPSGPTCPCAQVNTVVSNFASAGFLNTGNLTITVSYPDGSNLPGSRVDVSASYPYAPLIPYFNSMLSTTLSSTSEGVIAF